MSILEIYVSSYQPITVFLFYVIIAFLIAILIVSNKLNNAVDTNNVNKYNDNIKILKGLIWSNYVIQLILFIYMFIGVYYMLKAPFENIRRRRKPGIISNIALFCMMIISTGLIYYINNGLNNVDITNAKDELYKIYVIIPIITIITILLLLFNLGFSYSVLRSLNYYINTHTVEPISVTRNNSPSNLSLSNDDVPAYLPNRLSLSPYSDEDY